MKGECLAGCKGQRESIFVNLMTGAFSFAVFPAHQAGESARPFFNLIVLVTFLQPFNDCDYDDFRYFGLELLNLLLTNSEGLSHCYLIYHNIITLVLNVDIFYINFACERQNICLNYLRFLQPMGTLRALRQFF